MVIKRMKANRGNRQEEGLRFGDDQDDLQVARQRAAINRRRQALLEAKIEEYIQSYR